LKEIGMTYSGLSRIRNGLTGEYVDAEILVAPTNQQRLLKFVIDDQQVIGGHTRTDPLTQQPTSGGARSGGLKLGEMERDVLNAHGDQNFSLEKFCKDSDGSTNYICYRCSMPAVLNTDRKIYLCYNCREYAEIERVPSTHSSIVLQQMMASSGITFRQELKLREFRPLEDSK
jgi:DNA-directed RNA polymerase subunit B'